jgi:hypothetical protein
VIRSLEWHHARVVLKRWRKISLFDDTEKKPISPHGIVILKVDQR